MTSTLHAETAEPAAPPPLRTAAPIAVPHIAMWLMAVGSFLSLTGFAWDIQWHTEVGPDTFFTVPHLFIYAGSAVIGLVCLVMSLRILNAERIAGDRLSLTPIPRPYLIAGFGTVIFLLCGLWDEWWHSVYGFDVKILSPPHIGLLTCVQIGMVGTVVAFASSARRTDGFGAGPRRLGGLLGGLRPLLASRTLGIVAMAAGSASFLIFFSGLTGFLPLDAIGIQGDRLYIGVVFVLALLFAASASGVRFAATSVAIAIIVLKLASGWFTLAATDWYAGSLGLFLRDSVLADPANRVSEFSDALPTWWVVLIAALLIDAALIVGARRSTGSDATRGRVVVAVAGAASGLMMSLYAVGSWADRLGYTSAIPSPGTVTALGLLGAAAGVVAWQLGVIARSTR